MHRNSIVLEDCSEQAGYIEVPGAHLYGVLHTVSNPIARVLLVGPFAAERHLSYIPWVRWARYLAMHGVESLRYDYRGVGESTGVFEEMTFEKWSEDVEVLVTWLKAQSPSAPVIIHGLELGCILAGRAFARGMSDALLLWAPPGSANKVLHGQLVRTIAQEQLFKSGNERKPLSDYIRELEAGNMIEVSGYHWSGELWKDSVDFRLPATLLDGGSSELRCSNRVKAVQLDNRAAPLVKGSSVGYDAIGRDYGWLFADSSEWITGIPAFVSAGGDAAIH